MRQQKFDWETPLVGGHFARMPQAGIAQRY